MRAAPSHRIWKKSSATQPPERAAAPSLIPRTRIFSALDKLGPVPMSVLCQPATCRLMAAHSRARAESAPDQQPFAARRHAPKRGACRTRRRSALCVRADAHPHLAIPPRPPPSNPASDQTASPPTTATPSSRPHAIPIGRQLVTGPDRITPGNRQPPALCPPPAATAPNPAARRFRRRFYRQTT